MKVEEDTALYMVVDLKHAELPLVVGNIQEISEHENTQPGIIRARIKAAAKRGSRCKYVRVEQER